MHTQLKIDDLSACVKTIMTVLHYHATKRPVDQLVTVDFDHQALQGTYDQDIDILSAHWETDKLIIKMGYVPGNWPFRCTFRRSTEDRWRLHIFEHGCPVCLGDGVLDGTKCDFCEDGYVPR
jgi:hypothetical protein